MKLKRFCFYAWKWSDLNWYESVSNCHYERLLLLGFECSLFVTAKDKCSLQSEKCVARASVTITGASAATTNYYFNLNDVGNLLSKWSDKWNQMTQCYWIDVHLCACVHHIQLWLRKHIINVISFECRFLILYEEKESMLTWNGERNYTFCQWIRVKQNLRCAKCQILNVFNPQNVCACVTVHVTFGMISIFVSAHTKR